MLHPERRRREDEGRLPFAPVGVARVGLPRDQDVWSTPAKPPAPEALAAALAATPPLPLDLSGAGGAEALRAVAGPRAEALDLAQAALERDPTDADAHRALARLDLARALEGRRLDDGAGVGTSFAYAWPIDRAALCRAEAHLLTALSLDPASPGACLERALVIAADDGERPTRAAEVHAWLALGDRLGPPGCAAAAKAALRRYLREATADGNLLGPRLEVAELQRHIVEIWRSAARSNPAIAARTLEAVQRASRRP